MKKQGNDLETPGVPVGDQSMVVYFCFLRRICRVSLEKDAVSLKCISCKTRMAVVILNWQGWFKVIVQKCTARCIFVETKTPSVGGHQSSEQFYFRGHQITLDLPQISTMLSLNFVLFSTKVDTQLQLFAFYFPTMLILAFFPRESVHFPNQLITSRDLPWQHVFVQLGWLFHTAPLSAMKIHMFRQIAKQAVERKNPWNQIRDDFVCLSLLVFSWTVGGPSNCLQQLLPVSWNMFCSPM